MQRRPFRLPKPARVRRRNLSIFTPEWGSKYVFRKWAECFVEKNFWRVEHFFMDKEDALQECAVIFAKCHRKYYGRVDNPKWFMALYMRAVINKFHTYARHDERYRMVIDDNTNVDYTAFDDQGDLHMQSVEPYEDAIGPLAVAIAELPYEIRLAVKYLAQAPSELIQLIFDPPAIRAGMPKPDPILQLKASNRRLHKLLSISNRNPRRPCNFVEYLRDLAQT